MENFAKFFEKAHGSFITRVENKKILNEGLITSYPIDSLIAGIYNNIDLQPFIKYISKHVMDSSGSATIDFVVEDKFLYDFKKNLSNFIKVYGYHISLVYSCNKPGHSMVTVEPKFPFILDHKYLKNLKCYHITNTKHLNKITRIGLVPRTSKTRFKFDGNRIYLLFSTPPQVLYLAEQLALDKGWKLKDVAIFRINDFSDLELYYDPGFGGTLDTSKDTDHFPVFTLENIEPSRLERII